MGRSAHIKWMEENREKNSFSRQISEEFNTANGERNNATLLAGLARLLAPNSALSEMTGLPDKDELPPHLQDFIENIQDFDDLEKIEAIHSYTLENFEYINPGMNDQTTGARTALLSQEMTGDCDDYAFFEAALMKYAGIKNTAMFGGNIEYQNEDKTLLDSGGHAVALAKIDGHVYMLDLNIKDPVPMDKEYSAAPVPLTNEGGRSTRETLVSIEIKQAMMFIEFGNNKQAYTWTHDDNKTNNNDTLSTEPQNNSETLNPAAASNIIAPGMPSQR